MSTTALAHELGLTPAVLARLRATARASETIAVRQDFIALQRAPDDQALRTAFGQSFLRWHRAQNDDAKQ